MKIYIINGTGDDGNWYLSAHSTLEKAVLRMKSHIEILTVMYDLTAEEWEIEEDFLMAKYDDGSHYDSFWIEEVELL